jgi:hypothetical protein
MAARTTPRILFTGYAPVHFVCFQPLYLNLLAKGYDVFVSGGVRTPGQDGWLYDGPAMYGPLGVPADHIVSVERMKTESYDVLFAANTKLIEPREVRTKVQIFHGVSFRNRAVRDENASADFYFLVGPYMRRKFNEVGVLKADDPRGLSIGFLKTDRLVDGTLSREKLLAHYGFDGSRPVILYAPTGELHNSLETMGEDVLRQLIAADRYDVLVKLHDHPKNKEVDWKSRFATWEGQHFRLVRDADVILPLFVADLLITDASSVSNEYSLLDRPMIFLDVPRLLEIAEKRKGALVDLDTWGRRGGELVHTPAGIVAAVDDSLAHPERHGDIRRAMAADLFYNPGHATESATRWLDAFLQDRGLV